MLILFIHLLKEKCSDSKIKIMETAYKFISATFGVSFAAGLVIIGAIIWLTHYITKKVTCIEKDHSDLSKSTEKTETHIDEIRKDISYIKGSIDIINNNVNTTPLVQSHSPISLTDAGKDVADELKADELISKNWETIYNGIASIKNQTAYDIQQYCIETASVEPNKFFDEQTMIALKNFAYKKGAPLQLYLRLLGVIIRDKYFEKEKIPLSRIDETSPNNIV
jgi:hypothetical protein